MTDHDQDTLAELSTLSCCDISDALDRLGIRGQCLGIRPLAPASRFAGRAYTVRYGPAGTAPGTVGDYIDDLPPGTVVCLDNRGRTDATVWGDLLTSTAARNGLAGTVIDGVCRDISRALELDYPIFGRGNWMRTGKDRVQVESLEAPVAIGGVRVQTGDWLVGDQDGVVAVPGSRVGVVVEAARQIHAAEEQIRQALAKGASLKAARAVVGYHSLQAHR